MIDDLEFIHNSVEVLPNKYKRYFWEQTHILPRYTTDFEKPLFDLITNRHNIAYEKTIELYKKSKV